MIAIGNFTRLILTGLLLLAFTWTGYYFGVQHTRSASLGSWFEAPAFGNPAFPLDSAARGKSLSLATGQVEPGVDALYGLDHLTGDLSCWILNPSTGAIASTFILNVKEALEVSGADNDYVMATGMVDFSFPRSGGERASQSVVFVGEGNSGKVIGVVLLYHRQALSAGNPEAGELRLISTAMTRGAGARR